MQPEDGAGRPQGGFRKAPHRPPNLPAAVMAACLARATAAAHLSSVTSPLWPLRGWATPRRNTSRLPPPHPETTAHGGSREMPQSPVRWTSDRRVTRAGARQAHGRQTPPVCRRSLTHAALEQSLPFANGVCGAVLCRESLSRYRCPSASSSVVSPLNLILPATRMCGVCQCRPRQPISPIPGRPQGGSPPSLRPRTSICHRPFPSTVHRYTTTKHRTCRSIAIGGYRCCCRRDSICRRTRAPHSRCSPST